VRTVRIRTVGSASARAPSLIEARLIVHYLSFARRLKPETPTHPRMKRFAAKNRQGKIKREEEVELDNYIRVAQTLGIFQSKARRSLKAIRAMESGDE
jgi:hypothetical protein